MRPDAASKSVVLIHVEEVRPLVSPGYDAGLIEAEMRDPRVEHWAARGRATGR